MNPADDRFMALAKLRRTTRIDWLLPSLLAGLVLTRLDALAAPAGLLMLCYLPGAYVVRAMRLDVVLSVGGRRIAAVALSLAVTPVALNALWQISNAWTWLLGWAFALLTALWLIKAGYDNELPPAPARLFASRKSAAAAAGLAAFVAFVTIAPYWPTDLFGAPVPSAIHDFVKHHAILLSLQRSPLPLGDPFFADEIDGPVFYYHFFYLVPATIRTFAPGLSIELAFGVQSALVAIATTGMVYVLTHRVSGSYRAAMMAALLTTVVGGLDVIPLVLERRPTVTVDVWTDYLVRIHNLLNLMIWTPQNILGILILLVGAVILSAAPRNPGRAILDALLIASLIGTSIWVAFAVLIALSFYIAVEVYRRRRQRAMVIKYVAAVAAMASLAIILSLVSLWGYAEMSQRHGRSLTLSWPYTSNTILGRFVPAGPLANLLDLPWILLIEMGALLLLPLLAERRAWSRAWGDGGVRLLLMAAPVAIAGFPVVRSHFDHNDLGQKIMSVALIAGAVMGGMAFDAWPRWRHRTRALAVLVVVLGLPVALWEAPLTAVRRWVDPHGPLSALAPHDGEIIAAEADAYRYLRDELPADAVIQPHWDSRRLKLLQIARRPLGVTVLERDTRVFIGPDAVARRTALESVTSALSGVTPSSQVYETLRAHLITHVFVGEIERTAWGGREALSDDRYFTTIYHRDGVQIVALK